MVGAKIDISELEFVEIIEIDSYVGFEIRFPVYMKLSWNAGTMRIAMASRSVEENHERLHFRYRRNHVP